VPPKSATATFTYRKAQRSDIPAMARIRSVEWETENYWRNRIAAYLAGELHPQHALRPRISYVCYAGDCLVGFIAGHLTLRHSCHGELEWINVIPKQRGTAIASELLRLLAAWFVRQKALRVCVDVQPTNRTARRFYRRHGVEDLNLHWLVWNDIGTILNEHEPATAGRRPSSRPRLRKRPRVLPRG
jgi:ribosomal protein S18 acetylase RimI-like enzyme